jgi:hypothetical protein
MSGRPYTQPTGSLAHVETLAGMLLERRTIEDRDEIIAACDGILDAGLTLPKWRRRLTVTKAEGEEMRKAGAIWTLPTMKENQSLPSSIASSIVSGMSCSIA